MANKIISSDETENKSSATVDGSLLETHGTMNFAIEILTKELLDLKAYLRKMLRMGDERQYTYNLTSTQDQVNELEGAIEWLQKMRLN
jgi:hypothetical protein